MKSCKFKVGDIVKILYHKLEDEDLDQGFKDFIENNKSSRLKVSRIGSEGDPAKWLIYLEGCEVNAFYVSELKLVQGDWDE